ncbi:hypothetical protein [Blastococcus sp. VKM Ac-2987]|uniref:hypothetical protein n=1 Tax=Blastococcus sp. VKM Ac-2987 TaxID=3004141 RepID=UPI0022AB57D3|nr:hypothetical protein [Blastococcus sp. VKM Ac-2987]MCZ2859956.1 hypothetical protein [Blastococcus sp. VKM Ac-2987]
MTTFPREGTAVLAVPAGVRALGRAAALLAFGSAVVHLLLVDASSLGSLAMLGMALACLPCGWHLWRNPSGRVWAMTAAVDAAMLAIHLQMLAPPSGHVHAAGPAPLMWLGLGLVGAQLVAATLAAGATARR